MLPKIIDCESFENSPVNGVYFNKAVSLQWTARNFTKNGVHVRPD